MDVYKDQIKKIQESNFEQEKILNKGFYPFICVDCGKEITGAVFHNMSPQGAGPRCFECAIDEPKSIIEDFQYQPQKEEEVVKFAEEESYDKEGYKLALIDFIMESRCNISIPSGDILKYIKAVLKV